MHITIGAVSKRSGVNIETIRYYERIGLIPPPQRTAGGHRQYDGDDVDRLVFVRRSRELGFSLDEIRSLLRLAGRGYSCGEVREMTMAHAGRIREKMEALRRMERQLLDTAAKCKGGTAPDCPILQSLSN